MSAPPPLPLFDFGGLVIELPQYTIYEAHNPHRMLIRTGNDDLLSDGWTARYIFYVGDPYQREKAVLYVHETLQEPHRSILSLNAEPSQGWFIHTTIVFSTTNYDVKLYIGEASDPFRQMVDRDQDSLLQYGWISANLPALNVHGHGFERVG